MKIIKSGAKPSSIVKLARSIDQKAAAEGVEYLRLERGINGVCPIDLGPVLPLIDFESPAVLNYPPSTGRPELKTAINAAYFGVTAAEDRICVTNGGSMGLDIAFDALDVVRFVLPEYHWGTYRQILRVRRKPWAYYGSLEELCDHPERHEDDAVVLCDPGNPLGEKVEDALLVETARRLSEAGSAVIIDCPYRRVFHDETDTLHLRLAALDNVVIVESFSKSLGLSGLRIGFIYTANEPFAEEFALRFPLPTNGVDGFAQAVVEKLLADPLGRTSARAFRTKTAADIGRNIAYLAETGLLAEEFYAGKTCRGIFAVVNRTPEELLSGKISAISLGAFTETRPDEAARYSRINVSVPHERFRAFFDAYLAAV
jgi:aspartate aminotransferase